MPVAMLALLSVPAPPVPFATQRTEVVSFTASDVTCSGQPIVADSIVRPFSASQQCWRLMRIYSENVF